jgi:glycosyltransferase involved in cell wall biosynthesis
MRKKPYISIIIRSYKGENKLPRLLNSIYSQDSDDFEVIVVDDASDDSSKEIVRKYPPARYLGLNKNGGPARARNKGAKIAKGEIYLFFDNDVIVMPKVLEEVKNFFKKNKSAFAVTGSWSKEQKDGFFARYKALRDWSYWRNELYEKGAGYFFSTRVAAVRSDLFWKINGFDESYKKADVEDMEFSYRLSEAAPVHFNKKMRVHHEFEGILAVAKKYFRRSYLWTLLFLKRRRFDKAAATPNEALVALTSVLALLLSPFIFFSRYALVLFSMAFFSYLFLYRVFLTYVYQKEGFWFMIKSVGIGFILYPFVVAGAMVGALKGAISWLGFRRS